MPDEDHLPPGPRRDLVRAVHRLYQLAGKPATRKISSSIRERSELPGTLSHEGVSAVLRGASGVPRWPNLESLVRVLAECAVVPLDVQQEVIQVHALWAAADGDPFEADSGRRSSAEQVLAGVQEISERRTARVCDQDDGLAGVNADLTESRSIPGANAIPVIWNPGSGTVEFKLTTETVFSWITNNEVREEEVERNE